MTVGASTRVKRPVGLSTQAVALAGSRAAGQLVMVLVVSAVARAVGLERMGLLATAIALGAVSSGFLDFGSGSHWIREVSSKRMDMSEFGRRSGGKLLLASVLAVCIVTIALLVPGWSAFWGVGPLFLSSVVSQNVQASLLASGGGSRLTWVGALERAIFGSSFVALSLFTDLRPEYVFFCCFLVGASVSFLVSLLLLPPEIRPSVQQFPGLWIWRGCRYYGYTTSLIALQGADVIIGGAVGGASAAGTYGAVSRWTMPITMATTSFSVLLAPVVAGAKSADEVLRRIRRSMWIPGVSVCVAIVMAILAEPVVVLLMGPEFIGSASVLRWLALSAALSATAQPFMTVLQARRRERYVARGLAISVSLQLLAVAPLVLQFGAVGIALAAVVAQCCLVGVVSLGVARGWRKSRGYQINSTKQAAREH